MNLWQARGDSCPALAVQRYSFPYTVEGVRMATTAQPIRRTVNAQNVGRWIVGGLLGLVFAALLFRIVSQAIQNPSLLAQQLITGVSKGAILAIIALGYTLVYGIIELINFAHGDTFMLGSFAALTLIGLSG